MIKQTPLWISIAIHSLVVLIIISFFVYFDVAPKTRNIPNNKQENLEYSFKNAYYTEKLNNDLNEEVKPTNEERFLCIEFSVKNLSNKDIFYVSIVEDPKLITTENEELYPDLSLSNEPFGNININRTKEGFLTFRIPFEKYIKTFKIGNFSKDIENLD